MPTGGRTPRPRTDLTVLGDLAARATEGAAPGAGASMDRADLLAQAAALDAMAGRSVLENNRGLAALLRQRFGYWPRVETTLIYPDKTGTCCTLLVTALDLEAAPDADPAGALAAVDLALTPAPKADIVKALTRLRLRTKARRETTADMAAAFALYAEDLAGFPADAMHETLDGWPRRENGMWWPSWRELDGVLRAKASFRLRARAALVTLMEDRDDADGAEGLDDGPAPSPGPNAGPANATPITGEAR